MSVEGCQLACEAAIGCDSVSYNAATQLCFLKTSPSTDTCQARPMHLHKAHTRRDVMSLPFASPNPALRLMFSDVGCTHMCGCFMLPYPGWLKGVSLWRTTSTFVAELTKRP